MKQIMMTQMAVLVPGARVLFSKAEIQLFVVVQLCQRNSPHMDEPAREVIELVHVFTCFIKPIF